MDSLKDQTFATWTALHRLLDCYCNPADFEQEYNRYPSDEAAFCGMRALYLAQYINDDEELILFDLIECSDLYDWREYLIGVVTALVQIPAARERFLSGLARLRPELSLSQPALLQQFEDVIHVTGIRSGVGSGVSTEKILRVG
jgi:hypothetical protein